MIAVQFLETGLWDLLWTRVNQSLKPNRDINLNTSNNYTQDDLLKQQDEIQQPDWMLLSPNGLVSILQLASRLLTMVNLRK